MTRHTGADPPEARSPGVAARDGYGREVSPFRPAARRPVLHRLVPVSERLGGQRAASLAAPLGLRWRFRKVPGPLVVVVAAIVASAALDLAAGISQGFPIGGSGSRTAVNDQMGARTQLSGPLAAVAIALVLLFLTEPMRYLPKATLGAVIVAAAIGMAGVVAVGVLRALLVAVALSIVDVVRRSAIPHDAVLGWDGRLGRYADISVHRRARITPGVLAYRLDDRLFFANAGYVSGRIREAIHGSPTPVRWLVFDAEALAHLDATGARALSDLIRSLKTEGIIFVFARVKTPMRRRLDDAGIVELVGPNHLYPTVRAAVQAASSSEEEPQ
jgi:SulP family sulfate permease